LLENILELARVESGRVEIESKPFAPAMLLSDAVNRWQAEASRKGLQLVAASTPDLPAALCGDFVRIAEVLDCLTGNAIKFTSQGTITLRDKVLERNGHNCRIRFEVADTGIGISPEHQHVIFGQFTQVDDSMTRKFGGAGVGLALSRRLVELMGGEIGFDSEPEVGSVFWFTLWLPVYGCNGEAADSAAG
jgi:signal transduction histidine kinase